jgi:hypothetical protein
MKVWVCVFIIAQLDASAKPLQLQVVDISWRTQIPEKRSLRRLDTVECHLTFSLKLLQIYLK